MRAEEHLSRSNWMAHEDQVHDCMYFAIGLAVENSTLIW